MNALNRVSNFRYSLIKIWAKIFNLNPFEIIYNKKFYDEMKEIDRVTNSSKTLADAINSFLKPKTVVDTGCGIGVYMSALEDKKIKCLGIEGSRLAIKYSVVNKRNIFLADITRKINLNKKFDLVLCIEVAEHIPNSKSNILVNNLTSFGDTILFTAAKKGQGGTDHINEQPSEFWINLFKRNSFILDAKTTEKLKIFCQKKKCIWWITNNLLIFRKEKFNHNIL